MSARVVDLHERLSLFSEHRSPKVVAPSNDYAVKVVRLKGEFVGHSHPETDELFLPCFAGDPVVEGRARPALRGPEGRPAPAGRRG